jgi:hypothetical protein
MKKISCALYIEGISSYGVLFIEIKIRISQNLTIYDIIQYEIVAL